METLFGLLGQILEGLLSVIPRIIIVRATHNAVKWKRGKKTRGVKPGLCIYWPLVTDMDQIVVARQTSNLPPQALMTKDLKRVVAGGFCVFKISDVVQAIGERNWDVESTVRDITQAVIVEEVARRDLGDLLQGLADGEDSAFCQALTENCRKQLRQFGVYVARAGLIEFAETGGGVYKIIGEQQVPLPPEEY